MSASATHPNGPVAPHVVIAGGGLAALETAAALRALAGARVDLTIVAPDPAFTCRALEPLAAFTDTDPPRFPLPAIARQLDAPLVCDRIGWVDRPHRTVHTRGGAILTFDALVLGLGAVALSHFTHALTLSSDGALRRLVGEIRDGSLSRLALIIPHRTTWPLPLYEVALMAAEVARAHDLPLELTLATAEHAPLEVFGDSAADAMAELLADSGIELITAARCAVPSRHRVLVTGPDGTRELEVDGVAALPELFGPHVRGVPSAADGFIPIDRFCRVDPAAAVYAAGDATDYPVKHGSVAVDQAGVVAASIAAAAGAPVTPHVLSPKLDGLVFTGEAPRRVGARLAGGQPFGSVMTQESPRLADDPPKLAGRYLPPLLNALRG